MASDKNRCLTREEVEAATRTLASDLAFCARRPVNIQLVGGSHIAYTYDTDQTKRTIPIVMNPSILEKVRNKERAIRIWRGIGFHELAHHMWPAGEQYKTAHKEGFRHLFNLVDDEQNERRGRAFDETWGACFQSVCAFIFPGKDQDEETLIAGIVDGDKKPRAPRGRAAHKTYTKRWNTFAFHFRRHIPDCPDPVVAEALALIPKRFMDLSKEDLLELTRRIHETLAQGIVLPTEDPNAPKVAAKPGEKPEDKDKDGDEDDDEDDEEEEPEAEPQPEPEPEPKKDEEEKEEPKRKGTWSLKKLLRSKWTYVPFGVFVAVWFAILLQGGTNFWVKVFVNTVIFGGIFTAFLFIRRAQIKAMLARAKASISSGSPGGPAREPLGAKIKALIGWSITATIAGGVGYGLYRFLPWPIATMFVGLAAMVGAMSWFFKTRRKAREKDAPPSKAAIFGIAFMSLISLGMMLFGLRYMGVKDFWLSSFGALILSAVMLGSLFLVNDRQKIAARAAGKKTPWQRFQAACGRLRGAIGRGIKKFFAGIWYAIWDFIVDVAAFVWKIIARSASFLWRHGVIICRRIWWKISGPLYRGWTNPLLRIAIVALPVAILLVIMYALVTKAGTYGWWVAVIVALLLLLLLILGFIYRKKLKRFIVQELFMPMPELMDMSMMPPLDMETEWFNQIDEQKPIEPDQTFLDQMLPDIYPLAQQLRPYLAKCGRAAVDLEDQPDGYDLTDEADLALIGETAVFITDDVTPKASVHLEIALDCSGSMSSPTQSLKPGEKFILGKFFALVLEQAVLGLPGVSAHFWGFTDKDIFDCGVPGEGRVSGLVCGGGNNDAAMLWHMGQSAAASGKDVKILLMLSDGQPSDCSWLSLHNLVLQFEQEGMIPWNFALDVINTPAFERFFTDLVGLTMPEAITAMGETLAALAAEGI